MKKLSIVLAVICLSLGGQAVADRPAQKPSPSRDITAWEKQAQRVTIIRDDWGIPHVYGRTDADAVFGVMYAQAEDDFNRVETNYLNSMGRLAEAEGESAIYRDLRMKLFIDPADMKAQYAKAPAWLKALMNAYAAGLNYYLYTHPQVKPRVITRFEPWMALTFSEGSIGGDIEQVNMTGLAAFYGKSANTDPNSRDRGTAPEPCDAMTDDGGAGLQPSRGAGLQPCDDYVEPSGSNGAAIAPSNTVAHHALLLINPHTSFYFRAEAQMVSDEGLNAYGAITWGQFFIYQGFNDRAGWMHTSSGVDNIDEYLETVTKKGDAFTYRYGSEQRPITASTITVPYRTATGMAQKTFTVYRTHHGPVVREQDGKWVSVRLMQEPLKALTQSYIRTKARNYKTFRNSMELHTNSSNNTIYADADGAIAYFHANFIPKRDPRFDWTKPVDGSDPATEWKGPMSIDETPGLLNPRVGWLYNCNNWPWSAAGPDSPKRENYPAYVDGGTEESARGIHALRVLQDKRDFTLDSLIAAAYDSYLPAFDTLLPPLFKAYDSIPAGSPLKGKVAEQIEALRSWDQRWSETSVATSLAVYWGQRVGARANTASADQLLQALADASDTLARDFGTWKTPWGEINRFQRRTGEIAQSFDDAAPSIPVGFTSSRWGSLASFGARTFKTKRMYGTTGNSFVAVVEFGDRVQAKAVTAGGESGDPASPHFNDQVKRYATGNLRPVYFYRSQLDGHIERQYHPGDRRQ